MVMGKDKQVESCQLLGQVVIAAAVLPSAVGDKHEGPKWSINVQITNVALNPQRLQSCKGNQFSNSISDISKHQAGIEFAEVEYQGNHCHPDLPLTWPSPGCCRMDYREGNRSWDRGTMACCKFKMQMDISISWKTPWGLEALHGSSTVSDAICFFQDWYLSVIQKPMLSLTL